MVKQLNWNDIAQNYHKSIGESGDIHHRKIINPVIFKLLGKISGKKILDLGCGQGYLTRKIAKKGAEVWGVDNCEELLKIAINQERIKKQNINYYLCDAAYLKGIPSKYFDMILANMSFRDIKNIKNTMKECKRVLKKNGILIFSIIHPCFAGQERSSWLKQKKKGKIIFSRQIFTYLRQRKIKMNAWTNNHGYWYQYHRPISFYINLLTENNFMIKKILELAEKNIHQNDPKFKRDYKYKKEVWYEIPSFLVIKAIKIK